MQQVGGDDHAVASPAEVEDVVFPAHLYEALVAHARRKLSRRYVEGEEQAPKAYGLVGGRLVHGHGEVTHVVPLLRNQRDEPHLKPVLDQVMDDLAIPSETPLSGRGWATDPRELLAADLAFDAAGSMLLGGYHMHRVPWQHDPLRDTCTEVDRDLGRGSGLLMFILSMVDPDRPVLRAYFEGDNDDERPVRVDCTLGQPR